MQSSDTKGWLSEERSGPSSDGLLNHTEAVWRASPPSRLPSRSSFPLVGLGSSIVQLHHPPPLFFPPPQSPNRIFMFVWGRSSHPLLSACWSYNIFVALLQVSAAGLCVCVCRGCVRVGACGTVCVYSKAWPEHISQAQWASWNSYGWKLSNYAIRSGYANFFLFVCLCASMCYLCSCMTL